MIIEIVMSILFNRRASLQVDPIISTSARSILCFLNGIHSICPKLPLFLGPPPPGGKGEGFVFGGGGFFFGWEANEFKK